MKKIDVVELLGLAALWGASFLLMRLGAGQFGAVALAAVRVAGAALFLMPLLIWKGQVPALRQHWRPIFVIGVTNSVVPFLAYAYAAFVLPAGLMAVFNATSPLFAAVLAALWLADRLTPSRIVGLGIGFTGVTWLVWTRGGLAARPGDGSGWAIVACLVASFFYGFSAGYTKKRLAGVPPMAVAAGSQLFAAVVLAVPAAMAWPSVAPSAHAWAGAAVLAVACTGLAYLLYFRLIAHVGPANAISVTFLIPLFAMLWGALFLSEAVTWSMALGCAVILAGTALTTGLVKLPSRRTVLPDAR
jgi:drug/metabolite transporter (DMT)-like permease